MQSISVVLQVAVEAGKAEKRRDSLGCQPWLKAVYYPPRQLDGVRILAKWRVD